MPACRTVPTREEALNRSQSRVAIRSGDNTRRTRTRSCGGWRLSSPRTALQMFAASEKPLEADDHAADHRHHDSPPWRSATEFAAPVLKPRQRRRDVCRCGEPHLAAPRSIPGGLWAALESKEAQSANIDGTKRDHPQQRLQHTKTGVRRSRLIIPSKHHRRHVEVAGDLALSRSCENARRPGRRQAGRLADGVHRQS